VKQPLARSGATLVTSADKRYIWVKLPLAFSGATLVTSADKRYICVKPAEVTSVAPLQDRGCFTQM
jgi:hypothetical protein